MRRIGKRMQLLQLETLPQYLEHLQQERNEVERLFQDSGSSDVVDQMLYTDLHNWLVDDLLMKVDKMGMLASLEAR